VPLLIAGALLVLGQYLVRSLLPWGGGLELAPTLLLAVHLLLGVVEAPLAWWLYSTRGQGSRRLSDPGSATLFLFLVPGAVLVGFALLRAGLRVLLEDEPPAGPSFQGFLLLFLHDWLQRALGVLIVAPPLLVSVTPWLLRHKWIRPEPHRAAVARPDRQNSADRTRYSAETLPLAATSHWGDWVEVIGLAIGAGILCLLLGQVPNRRELLGWHLWGVQLLLILWASMRQGLRGGTLVAAVAASLPLVALPSSRLNRPEDPLFALLIQRDGCASVRPATAGWCRTSPS
jgi:integral membrane sensor domain MASE1